MNAKSTKRIFLVNRAFQIKYAKIAFLVGLASTLLTVVLILYPLHHFGVIRFPTFLPAPFLVAILIGSLVNFIIIVGGTIIMTHRVAGPMFSMVRTMRQVQSGFWQSRLRVRDSDDFKYVVRNFNELLDYFESTSKEDLQKIKSVIETSDRGDGEKVKSELIQLQEAMQGRVVTEGTAS